MGWPWGQVRASPIMSSMRASRAGVTPISKASASSCTSSQGMPMTLTRNASTSRWRLTTCLATSMPWSVRTIRLPGPRPTRPSASSRRTMPVTLGGDTCMARARLVGVRSISASPSQYRDSRYSWMAGVRVALSAMGLWYVAPASGSAAAPGHHHPALHAGVQGALVAELAHLGEAVTEGAPGLDLGGEAVALDVMGDRAVVEAPGDLGARGDLDRRGEELEVLGLDRRDPLDRLAVGRGGVRAGLAGGQCEREHKQEREEGSGAGGHEDSLAGRSATEGRGRRRGARRPGSGPRSGRARRWR